MLMAIDRRKKLLKQVTRYDAFEHVCQQLGITYTFPPEYYRHATRRWLSKKTLCIKRYRNRNWSKGRKLSRHLPPHWQNQPGQQLQEPNKLLQYPMSVLHGTQTGCARACAIVHICILSPHTKLDHNTQVKISKQTLNQLH